MIEGYDWASMDGNKVDTTKMVGSFAIVRASYTYGGACYEDGTCRANRETMKAAGKTFGAYMILGWHGPSPEAQADAFIKVYGDRRPGELPPALDLEANTAAGLGMTPAECLAWAERAYTQLQKHYRTVMVYTSARVWFEVFGDAVSIMGTAPLWLKVPYVWKARNQHHPESCTPDRRAAWLDAAPKPWRSPNSPGVWIIQYQGDAIQVGGFSGTVDLNMWVARTTVDRSWLLQYLHSADGQAIGIAEMQSGLGLKPDGIIGPATFAAMTL